MGTVVQDAVHVSQPILPVNLFPFSTGSTFAGYWQFVNTTALVGNFGDDFRFESKPVFFDGDGLNDFMAKQFIVWSLAARHS